MSSARNEWLVRPSATSLRTKNPIRAIVDHLKVAPNAALEKIDMSIGDPTVGGQFALAAEGVDAVLRRVEAGDSNGYPPSFGYERTRAAIAARYSRPEAPLTAADVLVASGCSDALNLCIGALCDPGHNILLPMPGFSLYETLATSKGVEARFYRLLPEANWQADLAHLESLVDEKTSCLLVNNPSNPCGSNYSEAHLRELLAFAEKHHLPVISDEIYADMVFSGERFVPLASLTSTVPVLATGGLAKRFLVPGWRVGWVLVHDRGNCLAEIRRALVSLSQLVLGANSLVQGALPDIFDTVPASFFGDTMTKLETNARILVDGLARVRGLHPVVPQGTMYVMVRVDLPRFSAVATSIEQFAERLIEQESVVCLPGTCFRCPSFFRLVFTQPPDRLREACARIAAFCERHYAA